MAVAVRIPVRDLPSRVRLPARYVDVLRRHQHIAGILEGFLHPRRQRFSVEPSGESAVGERKELIEERDIETRDHAVAHLAGIREALGMRRIDVSCRIVVDDAQNADPGLTRPRLHLAEECRVRATETKLAGVGKRTVLALEPAHLEPRVQQNGRRQAVDLLGEVGIDVLQRSTQCVRTSAAREEADKHREESEREILQQAAERPAIQRDALAKRKEMPGAREMPGHPRPRIGARHEGLQLLREEMDRRIGHRRPEEISVGNCGTPQGRQRKLAVETCRSVDVKRSQIDGEGGRVDLRQVGYAVADRVPDVAGGIHVQGRSEVVVAERALTDCASVPVWFVGSERVAVEVARERAMDLGEAPPCCVSNAEAPLARRDDCGRRAILR